MRRRCEEWSWGEKVHPAHRWMGHMPNGLSLMSEVGGDLYLLVTGSAQLASQSKRFVDAQRAMELRHAIVRDIVDVAVGNAAAAAAEAGEADAVTMATEHGALDGQYVKTVQKCYNFAFEYHRELVKLVTGPVQQRRALARAIIDVARGWQAFVIAHCETGHGTRPSWAFQ
ncbi:PREDICTED: mitogen-activated protein kinase kinase kinase 4-like, partial [Priapulus caudatus]|uniref:Mitogen-activated protein kinase kinase kinase 4-like n=1 Tax=Priapulus caudatus TaxID=37621 RepID=A0ABM1F6U8_PRICU